MQKKYVKLFKLICLDEYYAMKSSFKRAKVLKMNDLFISKPLKAYVKSKKIL